MSLLRDLEQRLESLLEGFFTKQFKSGVQPVEIAKKLAREMDSNRTISVSKVYVPNRFVISLSEADTGKLKPFERTLISELQSFLTSHAKAEGYDIPGGVQIEFRNSPRLALGEIKISSSLESGIEPGTMAGKVNEGLFQAKKVVMGDAFLIRIGPTGEIKFPLSGTMVNIGRSADNHVVIPDTNVSRCHVRVEISSSGYLLKDLGSTNGTQVNGVRVSERKLRDGDIIVIGTTKFLFRRERGV